MSESEEKQLEWKILVVGHGRCGHPLDSRRTDPRRLGQEGCGCEGKGSGSGGRGVPWPIIKMVEVVGGGRGEWR